MRRDGLEELDGYRTSWAEREEIQRWLKDQCATPHEYDFWFEFFDDLEDCFDDLEPWRIYGEGYLENERLAMRGEPELIQGAVVGNGWPYVYIDPKTFREWDPHQRL